MIRCRFSLFSRAYNHLNPKFCGRILTQNHGISNIFTLRTPEVDTRRSILFYFLLLWFLAAKTAWFSVKRGFYARCITTSPLNPLLDIIVSLKGPKREIFDSGVFAQIRPIWIGDLGTRPKNY
jgi:hypothetical protein